MAQAAGADAGGVDPALLGDFLDQLAAAQHAPGWDRHQQAAFEALGAQAVDQGAGLSAVVDLYLSAAWRAWPLLPAVGSDDAATVRAAGSAVLQFVDNAVAAVAGGFAAARRAVIRREESLRREFVDDLLSGASDPVSLLDRADSYGLDLAGPHAVLLARHGTAFRDATPMLSAVATAVTASAGPVEHLVATRDGALVVVLPPLRPAGWERATRAVLRAIEPSAPGPQAARLAVGRSHAGPSGVAGSYADAHDALVLADRLSWPEPVVHAEKMVVYQVLLRDRPALNDLIDTVLTPLRQARGGPRPLLDTVRAFCETGGNTTRTAALLHLSPRAVSYRLARVAELTGWNPADPAQRYVLHTAVLGARAVGWPES